MLLLVGYGRPEFETRLEDFSPNTPPPPLPATSILSYTRKIIKSKNLTIKRSTYSEPVISDAALDHLVQDMHWIMRLGAKLCRKVNL